MDGYDRAAQHITQDCPDCDHKDGDCDDGCNDGHCKDGCGERDCKDGKCRGGKSKRHGRRHNVNHGEKQEKSRENSFERRKNFEFDRERGLPHKNKGFEFIIPDGRFTDGKQKPEQIPAEENKDDSDVQSETDEKKDDCKENSEKKHNPRRHAKPRFGAKPSYGKADGNM